MNKQAFTFLSLFTLVLLMAVYYVTLPLDNPGVNADDLIVSKTDFGSIDSYVTDLTQKHEDSLSQSESVLSSAEASTQEKVDAINQMNLVKQIAEKETLIKTKLEENSFSGCLVEIETEITRVVCPNAYVGKEKAMKIMSIVYETISKDELVEVSFE